MLDELRESAGRVDILVNNAGITSPVRGEMLELTEANWETVLATNLKGPFFLTQEVARWMIKLRSAGVIESGMVINISSISAYVASIARAEYCISKAGISMMTQLFAHRLAEEKILVYEVRPGIIRTDMTAGAIEKYDRLIAEGLSPIRRWGTAEDVGKAVAMLASGSLPFSTGEVINVDGGFHSRHL
jgi:NAD(P)-dependent dehydrogenase (short-subunit alcohol dehydrogenase family)